MTPLRIQRKRTRGWRMPPNTVSVTRPGPYGNPYYPGSGMARGFFDGPDMKMTEYDVRDPRVQVQWYREWLSDMKRDRPKTFAAYMFPLRGSNLACWCRLCPKHAEGKPADVQCADCAPCHVDVIFECLGVGPVKIEAAPVNSLP